MEACYPASIARSHARGDEAGEKLLILKQPYRLKRLVDMLRYPKVAVMCNGKDKRYILKVNIEPAV